jgi:hypothetical protein
MSGFIPQSNVDLHRIEVEFDGVAANAKGSLRPAQQKNARNIFLSSGAGAQLSSDECEQVIRESLGSVTRLKATEDEIKAMATHLSTALALVPAFAAAARCFVVLMPGHQYRKTVSACVEVTSPTGEVTKMHSDFSSLKKADLSVPLVLATAKAALYEKADLVVMTFVAPRADANMVVGSVAKVCVKIEV